MFYSTKNKLFPLLTSIIFIWCSIGTAQKAQAQCQAQITSITPTGIACPNETLNFTGTGQGVGTAFDFNGATFPTGWVASAFTLGQPCFGPSPDGTDYFWSAAGGSGVSRFVQTSAINASAGGSLIFEIDFGKDDPQPGCEEVDATEGVFLQYSINGGANWVDIQYFDPIDPSGGAIGYEWVLQNIPIPPAAETISTMFRWIQPNHSGTGFDNWGLDNISANQTVPVIAHSWDFGDGSPLDTSGGTVSHIYTTPGVYTVTYEATVVGGCTNSTTRTVTVENPTITAPADLNLFATSNCSVALSGVSLGTPTTTSACTIISATHDAPDPLPIGTTVVTWTATFSNGHIATDTQNVTVSDNQPPVITVPADVIVNADAGFCSASGVVLGTATATDNCGVSTLTNNAPTIFPVGINTVTWTATDIYGNVGTATQTVTVLDTQDPVIVGCPSNITLACSNQAVTFVTPTATDNCSVFNTSLSDVLANFNNNFANTTALIPNAYSFSDGVTGTCINDGGGDMYDCGNQLNTNLGTLIPYSDNTIVNSANFGVSGRYFTRKVNRMFIMAADLNAVSEFRITGNNGADGGGTAFKTDFIVNSNGIDYRVFYKRVCGTSDPSINELMIIPNDPSVVQTISTDTNNGLHSISDISAINRIYYILFATTSGSCQTVPTVTAIAKSFLDENITGGLTIAQTAGLPSGSTFPLGVTTNTFTATDASGNTATCSFTVTVGPAGELDLQGNGLSIVDGDITPSTIDDTDFGNVTTPQTKTYTLENTGAETITITSITSDNPEFVISNIPASVAAGATETFDVTFTPTGGASQTAIITINNSDCDEGVYDFAVTGVQLLGDINVQGNSTDIVNGDTTPETTDGTAFGIVCSATTRTFTIQNIGTGVLTLTGTPLISISGSTDFAISTQPNANTIAVGNSLTFDVTYTPNTIGTQSATVSITSDDVDENPYTFVINGTRDNIAPTAVCQNITIQLDATNNATITASQIDNGSIDNCSIASISVSPSSFTCANVGTNTVTLTVTDVSGNTSTCIATVTVEDNELPVLTPLTNVTREADNGACTFTNTAGATNIPNGTASDNCGVTSYSYVLSGATTNTVTTLANQVFNVGVTTVTWTATDVSGNVSISSSFTVTVNDTQNPVIICPADIVVTNAATTCGSIVNYSLPTATDNCGVASIVQIAGLPSGSSFPSNTTTNTFLVTDVHGNTTTCSFNVTVNQQYELSYSTSIFKEGYPADLGLIINSITISSPTCDIFTGVVGEDYVLNGKVTVSNVPSGLIPSIIKISDTEVRFLLRGEADPNTTAENVGNLTVVFDDTAFRGVTATNVTNAVRTDLQVIFLDYVPLNLRSKGISTSQIRLYWDENTGYESFHLYRVSTLIADLPRDAIEFIDSNLDPDTFYQYTIYGVMNGVEVAISRTNAWTYPLPPNLVSVSSVCESGEAQITLKSSAFVYKIYADETSTTPLLVSNGDETFKLPFVSQTTTFYISVLGKDGNKIKESSRIPVTVNVKEGFEAKITGENVQVSCENAITLDAEEIENATYTWLLNGYDAGLTGRSVVANREGEYQVRIQRDICTYTSEKVSVRLNQLPVARIEQLNGVQFCQNGIINATQNTTNATYEWLLNGTVVGVGRNLDVTESGIYTLQVTQNGCQNTAQVEVLVTYPPQVPMLEAIENSICPNIETILSVQNVENGVTYHWYRNGRRMNQIGNSLSTTIQGKYSVRGISEARSSCSVASDEVEVNMYEVQPIYVKLSEDKKSLFLEDAELSQNDIADVEWYFGGEIVESLRGEKTITPTENGYYFALVTNQNGCQVQTRASYFTLPVVTGEDENTEGIFRIYPNPSDGVFKIDFGNALTNTIDISIFDATGKLVQKQIFEAGKQEFVIDIKDFAKGMYLIRFQQKDAVFSKSVIIK